MSAFLRKAAVVVGAVALAATGVGAIAGAGILGAGIAATAGSIVAGQIASYAAIASAGLAIGSSVLAKKPKAIGNPMAWQSDPQAGIPIVIGRAYTGGKIVYRQTFDKNNINQTINTVFSIGPIEAFEQLYIDGVATSVTGGGQVQITDYGKMYLAWQMGAQPEAQQLGGTNNPGITTASKLSGLAADTTTLTYDTKGGHTMTTEPQKGWVIRGVKVYDPRKDSTYPGGSGAQRYNDETTWSYVGKDNPYLVGLTWLIGWRQNGKLVAGVGAPYVAILVDQFVEGANICDANAWTLGGTLDTTDDKWTRLKDILSAGGGEPMRLGAQIGCLINTPRVSLATISINDVVGDATVQATQAMRDRINAVVPRYMGEQSITTQNGDGTFRTAVTWGMVAGSPIVVDQYVAFDGGKQRQKQIDFELVQNLTQSQQLGRYAIENAREFGPITLPLKLRWMGYRPGDVVTAVLPEVGLASQDILLLNRALDPEQGAVTMTARSETAGKHAYALGQTGTPPATPSVSGPSLVATPAAGSWAITATSIGTGEYIEPALIITGAADSDVIDAVVFEYRPYSGSQGSDDGWIAGSVESPAVTIETIYSVTANAQYQVSVRYRKGSAYSQGRLILGPVTTSTNAAADAAAAALAGLNDIADDSVLSRLEKPTVIQDWTVASDESPALVAQAQTLGVSTASYSAAGGALYAYLTSLSPAWDDTSQDTPIDRGEFIAKWTAYYDARTALVNAMTNAAAQASSTVNLVALSRFESGGNVLWRTPAYNPGGIATGGLAQDYNGKRIIKVGFTATKSYAADNNQQVSIEQNLDAIDWVAVTPGQRLYVGALFETANCTASIGVAFTAADLSGEVAQFPVLEFDPGAFPSSVGADWGPNRAFGWVTVPVGKTKASIRYFAHAKASGAGYMSMSEPMFAVVGSAQIAALPFVPGPNALPGADKTSLNTSKDTAAVAGRTSSQVLSDINNAGALANAANTAAAIGAQLAADVADDGKFTGDEKKGWVAEIAGFDGTVPALVTQGNALGLNSYTATLNTTYAALKAYLASVSYTSNTTTAIDRTAFKNSVSAFQNALTGLANASNAYQQKLSGVTSVTWMLDPNFERLTDPSAWQSISAGIIAEAAQDGRRLNFQAGSSGDQYANAQFQKLQPSDRLDIEFDYYVDPNTTGGSGASLGVVVSAYDDLGNARWTDFSATVTIAAAAKGGWTTVRKSIVVATKPNYATTSRGYAAPFANAHSGGNIYIRNVKPTRKVGSTYLLGADGRGTTSTVNATNLVIGVKALNSTGYTLSQTNAGSSVTVNVLASTYLLDTGVSINYPSGTFFGLAYSTTYYVYRYDPNLDGGTGYAITTNINEVLNPGNVYYGYITTMSSGGTGGSGGGGGNQNCPSAEAWVKTEDGSKQAKDLATGDRVWCLTEDMAGFELVDVESNEPAENWQLTILTETGAALTLAVNTPVPRQDGSYDMAANCWASPVPVWRDDELVWERARPVAVEQRAVAKIRCHQRVFAASDNKEGPWIMTHNAAVKP